MDDSWRRGGKTRFAGRGKKRWGIADALSGYEEGWRKHYIAGKRCAMIGGALHIADR
jgi:hypothetical protein